MTGARGAVGAWACMLLAVGSVAGCSSDSAGGVAVPGCPDGPTVTTASELTDSLAAARPGDVIVLAPGTYRGTFVADRPGAPDAPIVLCGTSSAVLDGETLTSGYTLHLDGVDHWQVRGITVTRGAKGLVLDESSDNEIVDVTVGRTGEEAVHLRRNSSRNLVQDSRISGAGLSRPDIGEGIYVGSAESSWCTLTGCSPDRSDANQLIGNRVEGTTAESIDIKEGTTGGILRGNSLDGTGMTSADSLIDVKGNDWTIEGTTGTESPGNGAAVFEILAGWGEGNAFRGNRFEVPASAWAVEIFDGARGSGNSVDCTNVAVVAGRESPDRVLPGGCG